MESNAIADAELLDRRLDLAAGRAVTENVERRVIGRQQRDGAEQVRHALHRVQPTDEPDAKRRVEPWVCSESGRPRSV